jgi:hypothetical protein
MKPIVFILLSIVVLTGCKKNPPIGDKVQTLKGKLVLDCNRSPAKSLNLELWQDFVKRPWPQEDIQSRLLETITTDNEGNFTFETELDIYRKSIRYSTTNTGYFLAQGVFGNHDGGYTNSDLGDLYLNGVPTNLVLTWFDPAGWDPWDSISYFISSNALIVPSRTIKGTGTMLTDTVLDIYPRNKWFDTDTSAWQRKMIFNLTYTLHLGGTNVKKEKFFGIEPCKTGFQTISVQ